MHVRTAAIGLLFGLFAFATTLVSDSCANASEFIAFAQSQPNAPFAVWLQQVQYAQRLQHPSPADKQLAELQQQLEAAQTPDERRAIEREIRKSRASREKTRPYAFYGWSAQADASGTPINSTRSMTGFILPWSETNARVINAAEHALHRGQPIVLAFEHENAKELFNFAGRRWTYAPRASVVANPPDLGQPAPFEGPPMRLFTHPPREKVSASLKHERSETDRSGSTLHRYILRISCDNPPDGATKLKAWIGATVEVNGDRVGPIIDVVEVPRSSKGDFSMTRSFEFIALPDVKLEKNETTVEVVTFDFY